MPIETAVPTDHPLMQAWAAYTGTDEARNSMSWAAKGGPHSTGSMWAAFEAGWRAAANKCAELATIESNKPYPLNESTAKTEGGIDMADHLSVCCRELATERGA